MTSIVEIEAPRWSLESVYSANAEKQIFSDLDRAREKAESFSLRYKESLDYSNPRALCHAITEFEAIMEFASKPLLYAKLRAIENRSSGERMRLLEQVTGAYREVCERLEFFIAKLRSLPVDVLAELASSNELSRYSGFLWEMALVVPYALPEEEEMAIKRLKDTHSLAYDRLLSSIVVSVDSGTGVQELSIPQILSALYTSDSAFRKESYMGLLAAIGEREALFTDLLNNIVSIKLKESSERGIDRPWEEKLITNRMGTPEFDFILSETDKAYPVIRKYFHLKAKALGMEKMQIWDVYAPVGSRAEIPFTAARSWVLDALKGLVAMFYENAKSCFEQKRIHAFPDKWKEPGARCLAMVPSVPPYVSINYNGSLRDVMLMAHELGHAIHYSLASSQTYLNYMPLDFVSEAVAMFFENALAAYLIDRPPQWLDEKSILGAVLDSSFISLFRQHSIVLFEQGIYEQRKFGPLSSQAICEIWMKTQSGLFGDSVEICPGYRWAWALIPHLFHRPFYCLSYVFGYMTALLLERIMRADCGRIDELARALEYGRRCVPADLLRIGGVDDARFAPWDEALSLVHGLVERFEELISNPHGGD